MIGCCLGDGAVPRGVQWVGLAVAGLGLFGLTFPGLAAPDPVGALLMTAAGVSWGIYSLRGRRVSDPLAETAGNFVRSVPLALGIALATVPWHLPSGRGVALAALSGLLGSGIAYSLWYAVVPALGATKGAIVQLSMPVIAATGGVVLLGEPLTLRLALAGTAIVGGVALAVSARRVWAAEPEPAWAPVPTPVQVIRGYGPPSLDG
jgi:drug/metabolite transporter (DMT)-like permease